MIIALGTALVGSVYIAAAAGVATSRRLLAILMTALWFGFWCAFLYHLWRQAHCEAAWILLFVALLVGVLFWIVAVRGDSRG